MDFFNFLKNNKFIFLCISIVINVFLVFLSSYFLYKNLTHKCINVSEDLLSDNVHTEEETNDNFYVEIKGAVKKPGVYEANNKSIINDIVKLAGGFTKKAYTKNINLSRKVTDELVIYVFTESEYKKSNTKVITKVVPKECECSNYDISNCTNNKQSEIVSGDKDTSFETEDKNDAKSGLININTATKDELMTLSGIGEAKAKDIISHRETTGSFQKIEEIKNVSGIGDALFAKIKDNITV